MDEVDILLECHVYAQAMDSTLTTVTLDTFLFHQAVMHTNSAQKLLHICSCDIIIAETKYETNDNAFRNTLSGYVQH